MIDYRIRNFIILITPLMLVIGIIFLVKDWNQGQLQINNITGVTIYIDGKPYDNNTEAFQIDLWPDTYEIRLEKAEYHNIIKNVEVQRHDKTIVNPDFVFIPQIQIYDSAKPIKIPDEYKLKIDDKIYFDDNQYSVSWDNLSSKILSNLPKNILYSIYSPNGKESIMITSSKNLKESFFYYYNLDSEELQVVHPKQSLSGPTWTSDSSSFAFILPRENNAHVTLFDTSTYKEKFLTTLYNIKNAKQRFAIDNTHLIIIPTMNDKNIIDLNIQTGRKEKLTHDGDILDIKISTDSYGLFYTRENISTIFYLDLIDRKLYELPEYIKSIDSLEKYNNETIVFISSINDSDNYIINFYDLKTFTSKRINFDSDIVLNGSEITRYEPSKSTIRVKSDDSLFEVRLDK